MPHILKDGSDSIGAAGAALRVYVNIGTCPDYRIQPGGQLYGHPQAVRRLASNAKNPTAQHPFDLAKAQKECVDWQLTAARMGDAANFLDANQPYYLKNAPGGSDYITKRCRPVWIWARQHSREECARCHSSKLPPEVAQGGLDKHSRQAKAAWVKLVKSDDFLTRISSRMTSAIRWSRAIREWRSEPMPIARWAPIRIRAISGKTSRHVTFKQLPSPGTLILRIHLTAASRLHSRFRRVAAVITGRPR